MPRLLTRPPKLSRHKASGKAIVRLGGRTIYLQAPHGSKAATNEYDRIVGEWMSGGRQPALAGADSLSVAEVVERYLAHAKTYYRRPDGSPTGEAENFKSAISPLVRLYGLTPAGEFGPLALRTVRAEMIKSGWARNHINRQTARIRSVFKWAVGQGLLPAAVWHGLQAVEAVAMGRTTAKESKQVKPVAVEHVERTIPFMPTPIQAMVKLQLLTGMRSGEVVQMTTAAIDTRGETWVYTPANHKNSYRGKSRVVLIGPKSQDILRPLLKTDLAAPIFSPAVSVTEKREKMAEARTMDRGQGNGPGTNVIKRRKLRKTPGNQYTSLSYARAVADGCDKAFLPNEFKPVPGTEYTRADRAKLRKARTEWVKINRETYRWHPHQLRHTFATLARRTMGLEASRAALGHSSMETTEIYAEMDTALAADVARRIG